VINVGASEHQYSKVPNQDHSGIKKKKKKQKILWKVEEAYK